MIEKRDDIVEKKNVEIEEKKDGNVEKENIKTKEKKVVEDKKKPIDKDSNLDPEGSVKDEMSELEMLKSELEKMKLETIYSKLGTVLEDYQIDNFNKIFIKNSLEEKEKFANFILETFPKKQTESGTTNKKESEFLIY